MDDGRRVDQVAAKLFSEYSRARLQAWIKSGALLVDGKSVKPRTALQTGQQLSLNAESEPQTEWQPEAVEYQVMHQDDAVIVINKPAGLTVHPGAGQGAGTLANGLLQDFPELRGIPRVGIVHRLDRDTSGLMVVARNLKAHTALVDAIQQHHVERHYLAVVSGRLVAGGSIDAPIGRDPKNRLRMAVLNQGRSARTHYRVVERFRAHSLLALKLETGRTHQIRVHCAHQNFPLVGDMLYGRHARLGKGLSASARQILQDFPRQALCATKLTFSHPENTETVEWQIEPPQDFADLVQVLKEDADG